MHAGSIRIPAQRSAPNLGAWLPLACALACAPAARWWIEQARYAGADRSELWALALAGFALLLRVQRPLPPLASLGPCALCLCGYGAAWWAEIPLLASACAAAALACACSAAWLGRGCELALLALALLCLPVVALFQFQAGHVLRLLVARGAAALLGLSGLPVQAEGTCLELWGRQVWVDAPCSGLRGLWTGLVTVALFGLLTRQGNARSALLLVLAVPLLFLANVLRTAALFWPESGLVELPSWTHGATGLATQAVALCALLALALARTRKSA